MGAFFTNCNVRTTDTAKCASVLKSSISLRALVTDSKNGWITVYDEESESQYIEILRRLAKKLSAELKTVAIGILVHDSDIFQYLIYENGELVDQFDSKPVIRHLIGAGADVNANTPLGQAPLMLASMRGQEFILEARMKKPFPVRDSQRKTDWKKIVMILLEAGAQIPFPTKDGPIDVKTLSADQRDKLADALLEAGAKIKLP